jgi:hypothetical protein
VGGMKEEKESGVCRQQPSKGKKWWNRRNRTTRCLLPLLCCFSLCCSSLCCFIILSVVFLSVDFLAVSFERHLDGNLHVSLKHDGGRDPRSAFLRELEVRESRTPEKQKSKKTNRISCEAQEGRPLAFVPQQGKLGLAYAPFNPPTRISTVQHASPPSTLHVGSSVQACKCSRQGPPSTRSVTPLPQ